MTSTEQQAVLDRARAGDNQALGQLFDGFRPYVRLVVRAVRRGRAAGRLDDSDLIQDALAEAHKAFAQFAGTTTREFAAWLRAVALRSAGHAVRDHLAVGKRSAGREDPATDAIDKVAAPDTSPSQQAVHHEQTARLAGAIAGLPDDMQRVLLGRHVDGLSYAEVAEQLGRSEGAVRVLYTRALRCLRDKCGD